MTGEESFIGYWIKKYELRFSREREERVYMGYCIEMTDSKFVIKKENFQKALDNFKSVFVPENMTCIDYIGHKYEPHFRWVDTNRALNSKTLEDVLIEIRYKPFFNANGDIVQVEFTGEKYGDEYTFFSALAPYVEDGSCLGFEGEDGLKWEWRFNQGKVEKINQPT